MNPTPDDVWHHALDWIYGIAAAIFLAVSGAIIRLWKHDERIKALEAHHIQKLEVLSDLSKKIDANHEAMTDRLAGATEDIRADLRVITTRCLMAHRGN